MMIHVFLSLLSFLDWRRTRWVFRWRENKKRGICVQFNHRNVKKKTFLVQGIGGCSQICSCLDVSKQREDKYETNERETAFFLKACNRDLITERRVIVFFEEKTIKNLNIQEHLRTRVLSADSCSSCQREDAMDPLMASWLSCVACLFLKEKLTNARKITKQGQTALKTCLKVSFEEIRYTVLWSSWGERLLRTKWRRVLEDQRLRDILENEGQEVNVFLFGGEITWSL